MNGFFYSLLLELLHNSAWLGVRIDTFIAVVNNVLNRIPGCFPRQ